MVVVTIDYQSWLRLIGLKSVLEASRLREKPMSRLTTAAVSAALLLSGCASIGTDYNSAILAQLKPGMTEAEVIARMGPPNGRTELYGGYTQLMWLHSSANVFGSGGAKSAAVLIDRNGKFVSVISTTETKLN